MEVRLRAHQQEVAYGMRTVLRTMDTGHQAFNATKDQKSRELWVEFQGLGRLEQMGRLGRESFSLCKSFLQQTPFWHIRTSAGISYSDAYKRQRQRQGKEREERKESEASKRTGISFSGRDEELCTLEVDGCVSFCTINHSFAQPICLSKCIIEYAGPGVGGSSQASLSRPGTYARRNQAAHRKIGESSWEERHQKPSPGYHIPGEGKRPLERSLRSSQGSPSTMDEAHGFRDPDMGAATRRVSQTTGLSDRTGLQSPARDYCHEQNHSTTQPYGWGNLNVGPTNNSGSGCGRQCGRCRRQRRGNHAGQSSSCAPKLRRLPWIGAGTSQSGRACRQHGRCRGRQAVKAAALLGAFRWHCHHSQNPCMNYGRALGVESNPRHEAGFVSATGAGTDAYWTSFAVTNAACGSTDSYYQPFLTWSHSVSWEARYVNPWQAVSNALCLQWEVLNTSRLPYLPISLHPRSQGSRSSKKKALQVQFEDRIDVWIGLDEGIEMQKIRTSLAALRDWRDKPWSRRRIKSRNQHFHDGFNIPHCSKAFRFPFESPLEAQAPLSSVAVLSRVEEQTNDDFVLMQTSKLKEAPFSDQDTARVEAMTGGQTIAPQNHGPDDSSSPSSAAGDLDDEQSSSTEGSGIRPPSSTENRQEVIMFHLRDPPLRALLDWSDYDRMITEIAYHFATTPINIIDAYEINTDLPGLPPNAVPIIVHMLPDIAIGQNAKLALFDIEFHAHQSEAAFQLGPTTQRIVLVTPEWCDRHAILVTAGVDLYCEREMIGALFGMMGFVGRTLIFFVVRSLMVIIFASLCLQLSVSFVQRLKLWN